MRAWIERTQPRGEPIELPVRSGALTFGRSQKATVVFDDPRLSPRHCELFYQGGFWRVRDLASTIGTTVNRAPVTYPRAVFGGDVIGFGSVQLTFCQQAPEENSALVEAVLREPDAPAPWLVWADWLQEQGDPLGERIARAQHGDTLDHQPWLGPLWELFVAGEVELEWYFGFARRAVLRPVAGHLAFDWKSVLGTLLRLRVLKFLRTLVIDLPRLQSLTPATLAAGLADAQAYLAGLPELPPLLGQLELGSVGTESAGADLALQECLARRVPALLGRPLARRAGAARLELQRQATGAKLVGLRDGLRVMSDVTRMRRSNRSTLHFEAPPGIPFFTEGNPCFFARDEWGWTLAAGRLRGEVRVNGRVDSSFLLLPGDVIDITGAGLFRFDLD
jgi:uncharacterized protein (TIGR02996 family)